MPEGIEGNFQPQSPSTPSIESGPGSFSSISKPDLDSPSITNTIEAPELFPEIKTLPSIENTGDNLSKILMFGNDRDVILNFETKESTHLLDSQDMPDIFYKEAVPLPSEAELELISKTMLNARQRITTGQNITGLEALSLQDEEWTRASGKYFEQNKDSAFLMKTENGGESFYPVDANGNRIVEDQSKKDLGEDKKIDEISEELKGLSNSSESGGQHNFSTVDQEIEQIFRDTAGAAKRELKKEQQKDEQEKERKRLEELLKRIKELIVKVIAAQAQSITENVINKAKDGEIFNDSSINPEERQQKIDNWGLRVKEYFTKKADRLKTNYKASTWDGVAILGDLTARIGEWDTKVLKDIGGPFNGLGDFANRLAEQSKVRAQNARQVSSSLRTGGQSG